MKLTVDRIQYFLIGATIPIIVTIILTLVGSPFKVLPIYCIIKRFFNQISRYDHV
jgi:hypothetical protein